MQVCVFSAHATKCADTLSLDLAPSQTLVVTLFQKSDQAQIQLGLPLLLHQMQAVIAACVAGTCSVVVCFCGYIDAIALTLSLVCNVLKWE